MIERVKNMQKWNACRSRLIQNGLPHEEEAVFAEYVKNGGALLPEEEANAPMTEEVQEKPKRKRKNA